MSLESHLAELKRKHEALDAEIMQAQRNPGASQFDVQALKKRKLKLKDAIEKSRLRSKRSVA